MRRLHHSTIEDLIKNVDRAVLTWALPDGTRADLQKRCQIYLSKGEFPLFQAEVEFPEEDPDACVEVQE